jgi:hypothetical protein
MNLDLRLHVPGNQGVGLEEGGGWVQGLAGTDECVCSMCVWVGGCGCFSVCRDRWGVGVGWGREIARFTGEGGQCMI